MKIRKFKKRDIEKASKVMKKAIKEVMVKDSGRIYYFWYYYYTPRRLDKISKVRDIFVAEDKGEILGTASLNGNYLLGVYVNPKSRGKGIGKKLVEKAEKLAKKKGYKYIKTIPSTGAQSFYAKLGYETTFHLWILIIMKKQLKRK